MDEPVLFPVTVTRKTTAHKSNFWGSLFNMCKTTIVLYSCLRHQTAYLAAPKPLILVLGLIADLLVWRWSTHFWAEAYLVLWTIFQLIHLLFFFFQPHDFCRLQKPAQVRPLAALQTSGNTPALNPYVKSLWQRSLYQATRLTSLKKGLTPTMYGN